MTCAAAASLEMSGAGGRWVAADPGEGPDWRGLWFELAEEMSGEFIGMRAGRADPRSGEIAWRLLSHARHDGLGGFALVLAEEGIGPIELPRFGRTRRPSLGQSVGAAWRALTKRSRPAADWRTRDPGWRPPRVPGPYGRRVTTVIDGAATDAIAERARGLGVSANSLLLAALGRASDGDLGEGPRTWIVPVNLRGLVTLPREHANHCSYIEIEAGGGATSGGVHAATRSAFRRLDHWGNWLVLTSGRVIGLGGMRRLYEAHERQTEGRAWVGVFSNMGTWHGIGTWFVATPVSLASPLGASVMVCDGRMTITLEAHPSIAGDGRWLDALLDRWLDETQKTE